NPPPPGFIMHGN
nr:Chain C, Protein transport protein Sec31A [Homo sapiens]3WXA_D Chain D, Protein transport protein Sec31A [Homo sapiens]